jgi:hypothetical protein
VTFSSELGTQRVKAPYRAVAPFGSKIALYAHEDTLWFAVTGVESETVEDCENEVKATNYAELPYPWDEGETT